VGPVRSAILTAMLTDASRDCEPLRRVVEESLARPSRGSMVLAVRSFILNRVDVTAELAHITVPCLYIASDDRGDWNPEDAQNAARLTPNATAVTVTGARTLIPLEQPADVARLVTNFWARLG
jgi:pimeloyl-ACP methyl ester carboxylesterase